MQCLKLCGPARSRSGLLSRDAARGKVGIIEGGAGCDEDVPGEGGLRELGEVHHGLILELLMIGETARSV